MADHPDNAEDANAVAVWTLATQDVVVPDVIPDTWMTPERLRELRTVLAALADSPIATLEVHPKPEKLDRTQGIPLDSASPLAQHLSQLISQTSKSAPSAAASGGEALYRMVVPAKVAAEMGSGMVTPMASKAAAGGVHSALMGSSGIAAQATFVPVTGKAAAAAGGSAVTAGAAAAGAGALTIAAPLVLMAVAVGVSAHAEMKRQEAINHITELLDELREEKLNDERFRLDACRNAIDKATTILLDKGRIGASLGLDSAVHTIDTAIAAAAHRLGKWQHSLAKFPSDRVELDAVRKAFPGIDDPAGKFHAHLEMATLAIALKRRVAVLQAVEHAQMDETNPFEQFVKALQAEQRDVDRLDTGITDIVRQLSQLRLDRSHGIMDSVFRASEVDRLLQASYKLRDLGDRVAIAGQPSDIAIEMVRERDGSVLVLPAMAS